jgi:hypothetical protein
MRIAREVLQNGYHVFRPLIQCYIPRNTTWWRSLYITIRQSVSWGRKGSVLFFFKKKKIIIRNSTGSRKTIHSRTSGSTRCVVSTLDTSIASISFENLGKLEKKKAKPGESGNGTHPCWFLNTIRKTSDFSCFLSSFFEYNSFLSKSRSANHTMMGKVFFFCMFPLWIQALQL